MKVGNNEVKDILLGETPIVKVYRGEDVIWERGGLPSGYTRVQYLEGTGTQWIDSGKKVNQNMLIYIKYSNTNGTIGAFFGAQANSIGLTINPTATCRFGSSGIANIYNESFFLKEYNEIYEISYSKDGFLQNGVLLYTPDYNIFESSITAYVFKANGAERTGNLKVYSCKLYDNNTLVRDFIPCLDNNNRPCMYDLVTKQPFYNQGTGEFLYA